MLRDTLRTALVTGGARRIGRAIASSLADQGWSVAIHYRTGGADAEALAAEIRGRGVRAATVGGDLTREEDAAGLVDRAAAALGPIACVIHNASAFRPDRFDTATRASWDLHLEVNLRAPFVITQRFAAQLPADEAGNVIHLLDQRVWNPTPFFLSYTLSKSALWALTRTLALALAPRIRVNAIGPGLTLRSARQSEANFARQWSATPLGRGTTPAEIADAVRFILGAPSMTGQMIALDGGQHLSWGPSAGLPSE
jgi:NAD(P)-dependent dehydrogenase (short-subunit alcohol dehydrogenase family)